MDETRLRLRRESLADGAPSIWKLCKKYGAIGVASEPIVNVYLNEAEYERFRLLPGKAVVKRRFTVSTVSLVVIDAFAGALEGLVICEAEAGTPEAIAAFDPPPWVGKEITGDPRYSGLTLAIRTAGGFGNADEWRE